jgi:2-polyprenyl-3-methyl-5-hydroxy-6-metoxy-1,4-benzoquinol methylase
MLEICPANFNHMHVAEISRFDPTAWEKRLPKNCLVDRDISILELCKGKTVLHLGAADSPFHKESAAAGRLLHQKLKPVARTLLGIDVDCEAVDFLRDNHGITDIVSADGAALPQDPRLDQQFDLILCCDIIEHVANPGELLDSCKRFMAAGTRLVITTTNALAVKPAVRAMLSREAVHHDHVAYYSYGTLCSLLLKRGLRPTGVAFFCYGTRSWVAKVLFGTLARYAPGCADGILITAVKE